MLEVLLQPLAQAARNLVEADELLDPEQLGVVAGCAGVQTLDDGGHIPKNAGIHEG